MQILWVSHIWTTDTGTWDCKLICWALTRICSRKELEFLYSHFIIGLVFIRGIYELKCWRRLNWPRVATCPQTYHESNPAFFFYIIRGHVSHHLLMMQLDDGCKEPGPQLGAKQWPGERPGETAETWHTSLQPSGMFGGKAPPRLAAQKSRPHTHLVPLRGAPAYFLCNCGV